MTNIPALVKRLRDCEHDPMWDAHAEVSKSLLKKAADAIEVLAAADALPAQAADESRVSLLKSLAGYIEMADIRMNTVSLPLDIMKIAYSRLEMAGPHAGCFCPHCNPQEGPP